MAFFLNKLREYYRQRKEDQKALEEKKIKQQKTLKKLEEEAAKAERKKLREQQLTAQKKETAKRQAQKKKEEDKWKAKLRESKQKDKEREKRQLEARKQKLKDSDAANKPSFNLYAKGEYPIHLKRLEKFGKSKWGGAMHFVGAKGGVYYIAESGLRVYVAR